MNAAHDSRDQSPPGDESFDGPQLSRQSAAAERALWAAALQPGGALPEHEPSRGHVIARTALRVVGPLLLIVGAACVVMGFTGTGLAADDDAPSDSAISWGDDDGNSVDVPQEFKNDLFPDAGSDAGGVVDPHLGFLVAGGVAGMAGLLATFLGWGGALSRYQANEVVPALRDIRRGLGLDDAQAPSAPARQQTSGPTGPDSTRPNSMAPYCRECGARAQDTLQAFCGVCGRSLL